MNIQTAIKKNIQYQKKYKKKKYTKPLLFHVIEDFIAKHGLICYGGMAINAFLPNEKQFYDKTDIPDYDCFSPDSVEHAIELANILSAKMENVEVKSAMFPGTLKIFVNFIPIVDITSLDKGVFYNISKKAVSINSILYAPPNYLKISLYQELSRPLGDISRWEKIYERLKLLNQSHPLYIKNCNIMPKDIPETEDYLHINQDIIKNIKKHKWVVFGDFGLSYYLKYFPKKYQKTERNLHVPYILVNSFKEVQFDFEHTSVYYSVNVCNPFYQILYKEHVVLYVFITDSCQSYNEVDGYNIASIDTILSIYYGLSFMNVPSLNIHKTVSYIYLLENIKDTDGVCRRFHVPCVGIQPTIEDIRKLRDQKYKLYKKNKSKKLYNMYFFQYKPNTRKLNVK